MDHMDRLGRRVVMGDYRDIMRELLVTNKFVMVLSYLYSYD